MQPNRKGVGSFPQSLGVHFLTLVAVVATKLSLPTGLGPIVLRFLWTLLPRFLPLSTYFLSVFKDNTLCITPYPPLTTFYCFLNIPVRRRAYNHKPFPRSVRIA